MNVLVLGKGGREHALVYALIKSPKINRMFVLPGRDGFGPKSIRVIIPLEEDKLRTFVKENNIQLVVIGPEKELVDGWSDFFRSLGVLVFGPSKKASQLEASKLFAKQFIRSAGIPTSDYVAIHSVKEALSASSRLSFPMVLKADGLAAGKGVFIIHNQQELEESARLLFDKKIFGKAGESALLESFLKGEELSVFALTNGKDYQILPLAKDYKKLGDNNKGPNTGGMGAIAPYKISSELKSKIEQTIVKPSIKGIRDNQLFYRGILYIGLMVVKGEPFILEYNVRFGDPEAQVLLPLLDGNWLDVFSIVASGKIPSLKWKINTFTSCVVLASENYPHSPVTGVSIKGDIMKHSDRSYFLHAGTKNTHSEWITDGGRVLNAIGIGSSKEASIKYAYEQATFASWPNLQQRSDIGL